ncbi:hypothetical protein AGMMS49949_03760 [Alphaproteobacteria bacterium]|nr:hypothetical protein AGMMS49949_03760 [Alphaproteobacteria bacterium]GHS96593.1 hypothetical protein AGMMS50296_2900 [Alphaproteobacteria bacterium]
MDSSRPDEMSVDEILNSIKKFVLSEAAPQKTPSSSPLNAKTFLSEEEESTFEGTSAEEEDEDWGSSSFVKLSPLPDFSSDSRQNIASLGGTPFLEKQDLPEFMKRAAASYEEKDGFANESSQKENLEKGPPLGEEQARDPFFSRGASESEEEGTFPKEGKNAPPKKEPERPPPQREKDAKNLVKDSFIRLTESTRSLSATTNSPKGGLDAFVEEFVKKSILAWLDQHLPTLVEKLVQEEIKNITQSILSEK